MSQQKTIATGGRGQKENEDRKATASISRKKSKKFILFLKRFCLIIFLPITAASRAYIYGNRRIPPKPWLFTLASLAISSSIWISLLVGMGAATFKYPEAFARFIGYLNKFPGFPEAASGISTSFAGATTVVLGMMLIGLMACLFASAILSIHQAVRQHQQPLSLLEPTTERQPKEKKESKRQQKITPQEILMEIQALLLIRKETTNKKIFFKNLHDKFLLLIHLYQPLETQLLPNSIERSESSAVLNLQSTLAILENQLTILREISRKYIAPAPSDPENHNPMANNDTLVSSSSSSGHKSNILITLTTLGPVINEYEKWIEIDKIQIAQNAFDQYKKYLTEKLNAPDQTLKEIEIKKQTISADFSVRIDEDIDKDNELVPSAGPCPQTPRYHEELRDYLKKCTSEFKETQDTLRRMLAEMGVTDIKIPEFNDNSEENDIDTLMENIQEAHKTTLSYLKKLRDDHLGFKNITGLQQIMSDYESVVGKLTLVVKNTQALILAKIDAYINSNVKLKAYQDTLENMLLSLLSASNIAANSNILLTVPSSIEDVTGAIGGMVSAVPLPGSGAVGKGIRVVGKHMGDEDQKQKHKKINRWDKFLNKKSSLRLIVRILTLAQENRIMSSHHNQSKMPTESWVAIEDLAKIQDGIEKDKMDLPENIQSAQERLLGLIVPSCNPKRKDGSLISYLLFEQSMQKTESSTTPNKGDKKRLSTHISEDYVPYVPSPGQVVASKGLGSSKPHFASHEDYNDYEDMDDERRPPVTDFFARPNIPIAPRQTDNQGSKAVLPYFLKGGSC